MSDRTRITADVASPAQADGLRIRRERTLIERGRASIEAGDVVADDAVDAWLDHMVESEMPMPIPESRHRGRKVGA